MSPSEPSRVVFTLGIVAALIAGLAGCGGDELAVELSPRAEQGRAVASENGCAGCHGGTGKGGAGPAWVGLAGSEVTLEDGTVVVADTEYLSTSITDPDAAIVEGWSLKMPENELSDDDVAAVIAYIEELS